MNTISTSTTKPPLIWRTGATLANIFHPSRFGFLLCVFIPTLLSLVYQGAIASDIYVSESAFSIRKDHGISSSDIGMVLPGLQYSGGTQDQLMVNSYVTSRDMVEVLKKSVDLENMFRHSDADFLARLPQNADSEMLLAYFQNMVTVTYDERAQVSMLKVRAFNAEDAKKLNLAILAEAERFVNGLSVRMHESSIVFARGQLEKSEAELSQANQTLTEFRHAHKHFDPKAESKGVASILKKIYAAIVAKKAELEAMRGVMTSRNQEIRNREREIAALQRQFDQQNARLVQTEDLSDLTFEYSKLEAAQKFATKRYELALTSLEAAQVEAGRQSVYLVAVTSPSLPQIATEPRRLYHIASTFFLSLAAYGMLLLMAASINDHIRR